MSKRKGKGARPKGLGRPNIFSDDDSSLAWDGSHPTWAISVTPQPQFDWRAVAHLIAVNGDVMPNEQTTGSEFVLAGSGNASIDMGSHENVDYTGYYEVRTALGELVFTSGLFSLDAV